MYPDSVLQVHISNTELWMNHDKVAIHETKLLYRNKLCKIKWNQHKCPDSDPLCSSTRMCPHATFVPRLPLWPAIFGHLSERNERKSPIYFPLHTQLFLDSPFAALMNPLDESTLKGTSLNWRPWSLSNLVTRNRSYLWDGSCEGNWRDVVWSTSDSDVPWVWHGSIGLGVRNPVAWNSRIIRTKLWRPCWLHQQIVREEQHLLLGKESSRWWQRCADWRFYTSLRCRGRSCWITTIHQQTCCVSQHL